MTTRVQDIQAFKECNSYAELNSLMTKVIKRQMRSPVYEFDEIGGDSDSDNRWWTGPRYEKLVKINELGVITFNAEEGMELPYEPDNWGWAINYRCGLYCLIEKSKADDFFVKMKRDGFHIIRGDSPVPEFQREKLKQASPLHRFQTSSIVSPGVVDEIGTSIPIYGFDEELKRPPRMPSYAATIFPSILNPTFGSVLLTHHSVEFVVVDPFYNRPSHSSTGLYTTIIKNLGGSTSVGVAW